METSANADGFYFSVRSTRPVLLTRVRVGLRDGTAPTTVRVAVRRDGAAKRPQAARADWALWAAVGRATVESAVEGDRGWEFVPDEAAWREELAEFIRRRGDHFMSC